MTDEMKPVRCGCGGEAHIAKKILMGNLPDVYVFCGNCSIRTKEYYSEAEAIEAWNRANGEQIAKVDSFVLTSIPPQTIYKCRNCWNEVKIQDNYCSKCRAKLEWSNYNE